MRCDPGLIVETPPTVTAVCDPCQAARHTSCLATSDACNCVCTWTVRQRAGVVIVSVEVTR